MSTSHILRTHSKRLNADIKALADDPPSPYIRYLVDQSNMDHWFFMIIGEPDSPMEGGEYIGQLVIPPDYPYHPIDFVMLTPSGRFKTDVKICFDITGYHKDSWSASWRVPSLLIAFMSMMVMMVPAHDVPVGHLACTSESIREMVPIAREYNEQTFPKALELFRRTTSIHVGSLEELEHRIRN